MTDDTRLITADSIQASRRVQAAEDLIGVEASVLNHGYVVPIDYMGSDARIVQAARASIAGEKVKKTQSDRGLIRYLLRMKHTTPFEKVRFEFACKMPMFVARQWVRHRMASINEMSGRYGQLPDEFYIPELDRMQVQSTNNKQGSGDQLPQDLAEYMVRQMENHHVTSYEKYEELLTAGLARELARGVLPVNLYTKWYWTIDLWNLMNFLRLRLDTHAQYEIRVFAVEMEKFARAVAPIAMEAFDDYIKNAVTFSGPEMELIREFVSGDLHLVDNLDNLPKLLGSKREAKEFLAKLGRS